MEHNECCICGDCVSRRTGAIPNFYCTGCFTEHRTAIETKEPWVRYLFHQEKRRRDKRNAHLKAGVEVISLDGVYNA